MLSNSASSAVTSPWISASGLVLPSLATETFTLEPIFTPDLAIDDPLGVPEPQHERVRQPQAVVDVRGDQQRLRVGGQRRSRRSR